MQTIIIQPFGRDREYNLLDEYKGMKIVSELDYPDCIQVFNPIHNTLFIVCMDDSKRSGRRIFNEDQNNIESAKKYIDWHGGNS